MDATARQLKVTIIGDSRSAEQAFRRLGSTAGGFGSKIGAVAGIAASAFAAIGAAAGLGIGYAVKQAAAFQSSLNTFQAVSGATARQMAAVSSLAKKLGSDITLPATSAKDAADAMLELNKAGLSVSKTMTAAKGVLQLSAAAEVSNAKAAQITANALSAFGLAGGEASHVADLLAASSIAASGEMTDMADALRMTASTAGQAHVSINDTVTAISEMANKGIIGGQAGAALQQMLLKLESPTKKGADAMKQLGVNIYDAHGKMVPFRSVVDQFSKSTENMSDKQRNAALNSIFGARAIRAANIVLLGGVDAFDKMGAAVDRQGAAADIAKAKMKGLHGSLQALESAAQTLAITVGTPMLAFLASAATKAAGLVNWIDQLAQKMGSVHGFSAKFEVAKEAVETAIGNAIASVNWQAVWARAQGIGEGLAARFKSINWQAVGATIGDGIALAVSNAVSAGGKIATVAQNLFRSIDWNQVGRAAGPGIAAAMLSAINAALSPSFWAKNWDLILAVAVTVFGGAIGKVAGRFAAPLVKLFADAFAPVSRAVGTAILGVASTIERLSPRLASAFVSGLLRLPGVVGGVLGNLRGVVSAAFSRLSRISQFTIKVLGIDAAINGIVTFAQTVKSWIDRIVAWFKGLPGRIIGALSGVSLAGIGESIMSGLLGGLESGFGKVEGFLHGVTSRIPHLKGPEAKDRQLLVANGRAIMAGLHEGLAAGWGDSEALLTRVAGRMQAAITRMQAQLDASQRQTQDASNRKSLADAEAQLAVARKKGKGIADAEQAVQAALQTIRDTANQRELDRMTKQHDKIIAKLDALKQKAAAKLQQLSDTAGSAFDDLASRIQKAFDAKSSSFVSPAQQQIDALNRASQQSDLLQSVADAQKSLSDALSGSSADDIEQLAINLANAQDSLAKLLDEAAGSGNGLMLATDGLTIAQQKYVDALDKYGQGSTQVLAAHDAVVRAQDALAKAMQGPGASQLAQAQLDLKKAQQAVSAAGVDPAAVLAAQKQLQRAQQDLLVNGVGGLSDQAAAQARAHQQEVDAQQDHLTTMLGNLRSHFSDQGAVFSSGMADILGIIGSFDGSFADIGSVLGTDFVGSLVASAKAAASAAAGVADANGTGGSGVSLPGGIKVPAGLLGHGFGGAFKDGGIVPGALGAPSMILAHGGETVIPAGARSGGSTFVFHLPNYLGDKREVIDVMQREFLRLQDRGSNLGFAT